MSDEGKKWCLDAGFNFADQNTWLNYTKQKMRSARDWQKKNEKC